MAGRAERANIDECGEAGEPGRVGAPEREGERTPVRSPSVVRTRPGPEECFGGERIGYGSV